MKIPLILINFVFFSINNDSGDNDSNGYKQYDLYYDNFRKKIKYAWMQDNDPVWASWRSRIYNTN
jgi:hypothetical protein